MTTVSPYLSIITLNVNGLNSPIKRHRMAEWIKKKQKQDPMICCLKRLALALKMQIDRVKEWKKPFQENGDKENQGSSNYIRQNRL